MRTIQEAELKIRLAMVHLDYTRACFTPDSNEYKGAEFELACVIHTASDAIDADYLTKDGELI